MVCQNLVISKFFSYQTQEIHHVVSWQNSIEVFFFFFYLHICTIYKKTLPDDAIVWHFWRKWLLWWFFDSFSQIFTFPYLNFLEKLFCHINTKETIEVFISKTTTENIYYDKTPDFSLSLLRIPWMAKCTISECN